MIYLGRDPWEHFLNSRFRRNLRQLGGVERHAGAAGADTHVYVWGTCCATNYYLIPQG